MNRGGGGWIVADITEKIELFQSLDKNRFKHEKNTVPSSTAYFNTALELKIYRNTQKKSTFNHYDVKQQEVELQHSRMIPIVKVISSFDAVRATGKNNIQHFTAMSPVINARVKRQRRQRSSPNLIVSAPLPLVWPSLIGELGAGEKEKQGGKRSE